MSGFIRIKILILICILFFVQSAQAQGPDQVIKKMQDSYKYLADFSLEFIQVQEWEFTGAVDSSFGIMTHLKEDYFKIEGSTYVIVTDGKIARSYDIPENKVVIEFVEDQEEPFLLTKYLFDFPERYVPVDFREEMRNDHAGYFIVLEAKKPDEENILEIEVWIDAADYIVREARYIDFDENVINFKLKNVQLNIGIIKGDFSLTLPKDVRIIDLTK